MKIEKLDIKKLKEDPQNARRHGKKNRASIRNSLDRFGQVEPLVVKPDGTVIGGNGRMAELKALGVDQVHPWRVPVTQLMQQHRLADLSTNVTISVLSLTTGQ